MYPPEFVDEVPLTQMAVHPVSPGTPTNPASPGRTHMYYTKEPEYPFGWGLSYDDWVVERWAPSPPSLAWSTSSLDDQLGNTDAVVANVSLRVKNAGTHGGRLTVLAMWRPVGHS